MDKPTSRCHQGRGTPTSPSIPCKPSTPAQPMAADTAERPPTAAIPLHPILPDATELPVPAQTTRHQRLARFDSRSKNTSSLIWRLGHVGRHQHNQACLSWKPFFSFFAAEELGDCAYCWAVSQPVTGEVSQRVTQVEAPAPSRRPQVWGLLALQWPIHRAGMFRPGLQNGRSH